MENTKLNWIESEETNRPAAGMHKGKIESVEIVERDFQDGQGPQQRVQIVFKSSDEPEAIGISHLYTPKLSEKTHLGQIVLNLGYELAGGDGFDLKVLEGSVVRYRLKEKDNGFLVVVGDSVTQG